ncbi:hypothetical protein THAOC_24899, partial [Thalassiosira oceanica]
RSRDMGPWETGLLPGGGPIDFSVQGVEDELGYAKRQWDVSGLQDSHYEIKVQSQCTHLLGRFAEDNYYDTDTIEFILDRVPPLIYSKPQVKLAGSIDMVQDEEFGLSFTEPLFCDEPYTFALNVTLSTNETDKTLSHGNGIKVICKGNTISYRFADQALEGFPTNTSVTFTLDRVQDLAGNGMAAYTENFFWTQTATPPCPAIQWAGSMANEKLFVFGRNALDAMNMHIELSVFNQDYINRKLFDRSVVNNNIPSEEMRLNETLLLYRRSRDMGPWKTGLLPGGGPIDFSVQGVEDELGYAKLQWDVSGLQDSHYKIKVQSQCTHLLGGFPDGNFYDTDTIELILDKVPPLIYGRPQVKLAGSIDMVQDEEFGLSFTEPLFCDEPYTFALNVTLSTNETDKTLSHGNGIKVICEGKTIRYRFEDQALEGFPTNTSVTFTLDGVQDLAGNKMATYTENFFWDQSNLVSFTRPAESAAAAAALEPSSSPSSSPTQCEPPKPHIGMGCDMFDSDCDGEIDECDEDLIKPYISFKDGLSIDATENDDGFTVINSPAFASQDKAEKYLASIIIAEDDCASNFTVNVEVTAVVPPCLPTFTATAVDSVCGFTVHRRFQMKVDSFTPTVSIGFDNTTVERDDFYGIGRDDYLHIVSSNDTAFVNVGLNYKIEEGCPQKLKTVIKVSSNELEYDNTKPGMALLLETNDQRQSYGMMAFLQPSRCFDSSSLLCQTFSHRNVDAEDTFRYYQLDIEAIDMAGNVGTARAYVVVVPSSYKENEQDANYFVDFIEEAPDAMNVNQIKELIWDTNRDDPVQSAFLSITVAKTVTGEMSVTGILIPDDPAELDKLIKFLEEQLAAGLTNGGQRMLRRLAGECTCTSEVRITSISAGRRRKLQAARGAVIEYKVILTCEGNCDEDGNTIIDNSTATDGSTSSNPQGSNSTDSTGETDSTDGGTNPPEGGNSTSSVSSSLLDISSGLATFIETGGFVEKVKEAASSNEEADIGSLVAADDLILDSVNQDTQIVTVTETKAKVEFLQTIALPVLNFADLEQHQVESIIAALTTVLQEIGCILSVNFSFNMDVTCDSGCNVDAITEALQQSVAQVINDSIDDNSLLSQVEDAAGSDIAIISGVTLEPPEPVCNCLAEGGAGNANAAGSNTLSDNSNESLWYPAWGVVDKCSNAPGMPTYMRGSSHYTSESLEACCNEHFSWDVMGCIISSGGTIVDSGTQATSESEAQGKNCGGLVRTQMTFPTAEECCTEMVPWVATSLCVAESMPPYENVGTGKFYVSYEGNRCLKDCPVGGALCGGIVTDSAGSASRFAAIPVTPPKWSRIFNPLSFEYDVIACMFHVKDPGTLPRGEGIVLERRKIRVLSATSNLGKVRRAGGIFWPSSLSTRRQHSIGPRRLTPWWRRQQQQQATTTPTTTPNNAGNNNANTTEQQAVAAALAGIDVGDPAEKANYKAVRTVLTMIGGFPNATDKFLLSTRGIMRDQLTLARSEPKEIDTAVTAHEWHRAVVCR